ncbi:hypothetical protein F8S09_16680 [Deinococcus sp. SDU3-2]|uniref:Bacterial transcriptional activator domain-containing protein n=1 Tax=Deinococcus terrestris TaxID=2651870 RepID=A0A7X1TSW8_9DEIO|nr:hypothetical protein [Deinococcus terrestris]MPY68293.1 hypothetical protein [Deinococcus terrestris]
MPNFTPPRPLRFELIRHEALQKLSEVRDVPLVAVIAPSGYGKTVLLAQDARRRPHPTAWLTLDADAADFADFVHSVALALQSALPELHLPAGMPDVPLRPVDLAEALNAADQNVSLVLDNADILSEDSGRWLTLLVEHLREGHQVLVSSYGVLAAPLARLSAAGLCAIVSTDHLRFNVDEAREATAADEETAQQLVTELAGWPIAIALHRNGAAQVVGVDTLLRELVSQLPPTLQAVLPDLGAFDQWDEELIRAAELSVPAGWLDELRRSGLPISTTADQTALPHRELLGWLRKQLSGDPAHARHTYRRVAEAYQRAGRAVQAMRAHLRAGDQEAAEQSIQSWVYHSWQRGELRSILSVLDQLPDIRTPGLRSSYAYTLVQAGRFAEADDFLASLPDELGFQRESSRLTMSMLQGRYEQAMTELDHAAAYQTSRAEEDYLALIRIVLLVATGRRPEAHALARQLQREGAPSIPDHIERTVTVLYTMDLEAQQEYVRLATGLLTLAQASPEELARVWSLPTITASFLVQDRPEHSPLLTHPDLPDQQATPAAYRDAWQGRAQLLAATGQYSEAGRAYERALHHSLSRQSDLEILESLGGLAEVAFARQEPEQARAWLYQMQPSGHPEAAALTAYLTGLAALADGEREEAVQAFTLSAETDIFTLHRWKALHLARALGHAGSVACPEPPPLSWLENSTALFTRLYVPRADTPSGNAERDGQPFASPPHDHLDMPQRWALRVVTYGRLAAQVNGQPVSFPFAKAAELFAYLLTHGPAGRDQLVDALWDGSGDPRHADYFRVAVRRLRLALSEVSPGLANPVPLVGGQYQLAPEYEITLDTDLIRRACVEGTAEHLRAAWAIEGAFLPKAESAWAADYRDSLREGLVRATLKYATEELGRDLVGSIAAYEQVLVLDPASEQGYEGLILAQVNAGQHLLAAHSYERYVRMMAREYSAGPSPHVGQLIPPK